MKEKILTLIIVLFVTLSGICLVQSKLCAEKYIQEYSVGLKYYKAEDYQNAYKHFGKVGIFSNIKTPALFRQARCATLLGDVRGAKRNYSLLLFMYPHSQLYVVSEYNLAMLLYEIGDSNARKHFVHIIKYYPKTDYALASEYYVASIDMKSAEKTKIYWLRKDLKHKALNHFIRYVKLAPDGRFAQQSIKKIGLLGIVITEQDSLALADSYSKRGLYADATAYYEEAPFKFSWAKYAKNEYKRGNYPLAKSITEKGLRYYSSTVNRHDLYKTIDNYISLSDNKLITINSLLNNYPKSKCVDYLLYLKAKYSDESTRYKIYENLYDKYPNSDFSAEALYKTFYFCITKHEYEKAIRLGQKHIAHFKKSDTSPAVLYWMGKIYERKHNSILAKNYYKTAINRYPDSYYSYRAYLKLHKNNEQNIFNEDSIKIKPVKFPCEDKNQQDMAGRLLALGDYDFVAELYKNNKFVESWIAYKQGKYVHSVILAQSAMKKLYPKPKFDDLRWRLVYPLNYYDLINAYKGKQPSFLMTSIMREESHFNKDIISPVGAIGLMQLMPATANEIASGYGIDNNLFNPQSNIRLGCLYYSKIKQSLQNSDIYAVLAYNGGGGNVNNWINTIKFEDIDDFVEKIPYLETQAYVKKVMKSFWCYSNIYH